MKEKDTGRASTKSCRSSVIGHRFSNLIKRLIEKSIQQRTDTTSSPSTCTSYNKLTNEHLSSGIVCLRKQVSWLVYSRQSFSGHSINFIDRWTGHPNAFSKYHSPENSFTHHPNEPFVIMLGDHLCRSDHVQATFLQQMLDNYREQRFDRSIIGLTGVMTCAENEISRAVLLQSNGNRRHGRDVVDLRKPST